MSETIFIARNDQQEGPFSKDQLRELLASGRVTGATLCWYAGISEWGEIQAVFPDLQETAGPPSLENAPPAIQAPEGRVTMEILKSEFYTMPKICIENAEVVIEAGAMHYMQGTIEIESKMPSVGGMLKSKLSGEKMVRPRYSGTGQIYLEPTFGEVTVLDLEGESWILDRGAFLASEPSVAIGAVTNKALTGLFGGEGLVQTGVSGHGKVMVHSPGPLERIELVNDVLIVDGSFAVARTDGLEYKLEKATKGLFSSFTSGEGWVNTFRGMGSVLIAPVPNRFITLQLEFGGLRSMIRSISKG
ncbi:MAG: AIM24 family protein [Thermoanaerobaculales bacterium]|nr:AIM24 family protein [Thermoanaerobaculales bacterium]